MVSHVLCCLVSSVCFVLYCIAGCIVDFVLNVSLSTVKLAYTNLVIKSLQAEIFKLDPCYIRTHLDCVHTMPAHFENDEKCDGRKI